MVGRDGERGGAKTLSKFNITVSEVRGAGHVLTCIHKRLAVCVYRCICLQCHFIPTENKYSCGNEVKQEEETANQAAAGQEEEEGGVHLLAVCQEGMLSVAFKVFYRFDLPPQISPVPPYLP